MANPVDVRALKKRDPKLEDIAQAFGVERREGELLRSWYRRIDMAIYSEELEYKLLRELDMEVDYKVRREAERAESIRKVATRHGMVP